jgi:putative ABC transport system permease protein
LRAADLTRFALGSLRAQPLRSGLTALGIAVGIAAVVLLTAIGEGVHRFVLAEFTQFGTHLISVTPGKTETFGVSGAVVSNVRPLTLEDAAALAGVADVVSVVPQVQGNAEVEGAGRSRRVAVLGVGPRVPEVWRMRVEVGRFLPADDYRSARAHAVLGAKVARELFGGASALGQRVRVGGTPYRVVGVMAEKGQFLGFDLDDAVYVPAARALELFNREGLMEVNVLYRGGASAETVAAGLKRLLVARHGVEDFTVTTQQQMLEVLGSVLTVLTVAVAALGSISLVVGGVGVLTILVIGVNERVAEVGLLRAVGAERRQVLAVFLAEAVLLAALGGVLGLVIGLGLAGGLALALPTLPVDISWPYVLLAEALAVVIGLLAGALPARRAAALEPVEALRAE